MKIRKHGNLVDKESAGNGYHGRCEHCGEPLVTDLGYFSWEGVECIERNITSLNDLEDEFRSFIRYTLGLKVKYNKDEAMTFVKPHTDEEYTLEQLKTRLDELSKI